MLDGLFERLLRRLVAKGWTPSRWPGSVCGTVLLEVSGRRSRALHSLLVTWVEHNGERYLVTMPGKEPQWVKNMRAGGAIVTLRHGSRRSQVRLQEVGVSERAPILRAWYCFTGRSASPRRHFKLRRTAGLEAFERIAIDHPVFRLSVIP